MRLAVKELGNPERLADLDLIIWGDNLHAPLIERIVELPIDIYDGKHPARVQSGGVEPRHHVLLDQSGRLASSTCAIERC